MLGVVLLSPQNELIHAFGNAQFKMHFFNVPHGKQSARPSSSSGISSPNSCHYSSASSITINEKKQENNFENSLSEIEKENNKMLINGNQQQQEQLLFDTNGENFLLCQLLPLVAICRANSIENQNKQQILKKIQCIQSSPTSSNDCGNLQVNIAHLAFSYIFIMIFDDDQNSLLLNSPERLFTSLLNCINFHYGPQQFPLLSMNTPFVKQLKRRSLKELTKNVAQKFNIFNGDVRCLLICSDRYIASASTLNNYFNNEVNSIIKFIRQPLPKEEEEEEGEENLNLLKYQSEHYFLSFKQKQFLYNIFNISLNEKIEFILLIPSDNLLIIYNITECLQILENISDNYLNINLINLLIECKQHLENIKLNLNKISNKLPNGYFYYLSSPILTKEYIQFLSLIKKQNNENSSSNSSSSSITISRSYSQNTIYSQTTSEEEEEEKIILSKNLNLLTGNLNKIKRLLLSLLNELLTWNSSQSTNKLLPYILNNILNNSINTKIIKIITSFNEKIEKIILNNKNILLKTIPTNFGLDMLGYKFEQICGGPPFFFCYIEEKYSQLFSQLNEEFFNITIEEENFLKEEEGETMTVIRTNDKLLILQFLIQYSTTTKSSSSLQNKFKQKLNKLLLGNLNLIENNNYLKFNFICLFPPQINIILAVKQSNILINILKQQINIE
uniref:Uncharacterized protein n=2 Tax=Meloidogyne enterolobii TaxID=390850 RepID=A0A6V7W4B9_MELEN|nr:unnamed protein product [Meloidogyne enterolobii]